MLYWALMFLVVALVAGVFGFGGIASTATGMAQILFVIALVVFVATSRPGSRNAVGAGHAPVCRHRDSSN
jgi:uncharacterized membrane protein YtjA (UPF0391 family)